MLRVTNRNSFDFVAKFDNHEYVFPGKGKVVLCEDEAAQHIFGLGDKDKSSVLVRHGWAFVTPRQDQHGRPTGTRQQGMDILNKFTFEVVTPKNDYPLARQEYGAAPVLQDDAGTSGADDPDVPAESRTAAPQGGSRNMLERLQPAAS